MMTDSRGVAEFTNLDPAPYRVRVIQAGYRAAVQNVDVSMSPSVSVSLDLIPDHVTPSAVPPNGPRAVISANVPDSDKGRKLLQQGEQELFEKRNPKDSLPYFDKLVKSDSKYANGWVLRGMALMQLQRSLEAESSFRKAISIKPTDYAAQFALGVSLNAQNKFKDALGPLQEALKINPTSPEADYEISRSYWGLKQWEASEPYITKGLELNKDFAPLHVAMGNIFLKKKDPQRALAEYERYLALAPDGIFVHDVQQISEKLKQQLAAKK